MQENEQSENQCKKSFPMETHFQSIMKAEKLCAEKDNKKKMHEDNEQLEQQCTQCKKTFMMETHFQSSRKPEPTKMCLKCREIHIKSRQKPTSAGQNRRNIYLSHKKKEIEKSRGCQWVPF